MLRATLDALLAGSADDLSIRDVAQRAGVHETSIYRRWGTKANLILDAVLGEIQAAVPAPDTGSLRGDLVALVASIAAFISTPTGQVLLHLALKDDLPEDHDVRERFWADRFTTGQRVLQRAEARGELCPGLDYRLICETLIGALFVRLLLTREPVDGAVTEHIVDRRTGLHRGTGEETIMTDEAAQPVAVDRAIFQAELDKLRAREKAHTREGDAIAAARRRLPMVEVTAGLPLTGPQGRLTLLDAFDGRRQLIAYYFMWYPGRPAPEQCEGCTWVTTQIGDLSYLHSRDITFAVFCQGPYGESARYREFMGWDYAVVLGPGLAGRAAHRAPGRLVPPRLLPAGRGPRVRDLLDDPAGRGSAGLQLRADGPHRVRPAGGVGGLAPRLAPAVHDHPDRRRCARLAAGVGVAGRAPAGPVAPARRRPI